MRRWLRPIRCASLALSLAGCTAHVTPPAALGDGAAPTAASCRSHYRRLDARVEAAQVGDAQSARIAGYPYLRIDRFLADDEVKPALDSDDFDTWMRRLRDLDLQARRIELRNLPEDFKGGSAGSFDAWLEVCAGILMTSELNSPPARARLLEQARVADDYSISKRVFGLYPFTSLPFKAGVENLHDGMKQDFSRALESLSVEGRLIRYQPIPEYTAMSTESVRRLLEDAGGYPQGIPDLSLLERRRLFESFAPVYEIDTVNDDDRIGMPRWADDDMPSVDVARPVVFRRISYARFEGRTLLQLNYSVWFPARPSDGDFDYLSGRLDGITFRVTLDGDGRPLLYDSMHNCGCYHLFVPTLRLQAKPPPDGHEEPPLIPQRIGRANGRLVLRIAHRTHYIQRMYFDDPVQAVNARDAYGMHDDDSLRSLAMTDGTRRSLFQPDGLVHGTERGERWFFWPMGIAEPGAMRQWGHHATLFVGKRHFDDPHMIERYFLAADGS